MVDKELKALVMAVLTDNAAKGGRPMSAIDITRKIFPEKANRAPDKCRINSLLYSLLKTQEVVQEDPSAKPPLWYPLRAPEKEDEKEEIDFIRGVLTCND